MRDTPMVLAFRAPGCGGCQDVAPESVALGDRWLRLASRVEGAVCADKPGQMPVFGARPADRHAGTGPPVGERAAHLRRVAAGGGASAAGRGRRRAPRAGSLPGDPGAQARRAGRLGRPRPGPRVRGVHQRARRVLGRRSGPARRRSGRPGADRGAAAAPADGPLAGDRRDAGRAGSGQLLGGRGRGRGPQARRGGQPRRGRHGLAGAGAPAALPGGGDHLAPPAGARASPRPAAGAVGGRLRPAPAQPAVRRGHAMSSRTARDELTDTAADAAIDQACRILRLPTIRGRHGEIAAAAARQQASYKGFLVELLSVKCDDREQRRKARLVRDAAFPRQKRLEDFDYDANPNVPAALIHTLAKSAWVAAGQPCCLIGDSGTGKSHLLIGLGAAAAENGYRVRYSTAAALVNELVEAADDKTLSRAIARYGRVDLLCLDELGYLELDRRGAELLFQVFTEREERASIAIASNSAFSEWTRTFTDPRLCAAIVDRLTFDAHIITTGTDSYRLRTAQARHQSARTG